MSSTALSVSVTRSEALRIWCISKIYVHERIDSIEHTIFFRIYSAWISGCDHVAGFKGDFEEEVVYLLEIGFCHGDGERLEGE